MKIELKRAMKHFTINLRHPQFMLEVTIIKNINSFSNYFSMAG